MPVCRHIVFKRLPGPGPDSFIVVEDVSHAPKQTPRVGIHDHARLVEGVDQNVVGTLLTYPGDCQQLSPDLQCRQGFHGNLSASDILNQFVSIDESAALTNAVFMGMGEPLDNYGAVSRAIEVLTAPWGFAWSPKRITLSTIGVIPALKRYLDTQKCHLAVSLHNPFPDERLEMMPVQKAYPIDEVLELIRQYDFSGQRRVSFEYTMFSGFNDDKRHADALIRKLRGLECRVNLIRFHKIPDFPYETSPDRKMEEFRDRLSNNGIICTIRSSRGEDILAACGMLAGQHSQLR